MLRSIVRVLFGFILACLAAGLVQVLFALTPGEVFGGDSDALATASELTLRAASHCALFAASFALLTAAFGEWNGIRNWPFYALAGVVIALLGLAAQYSSEDISSPTIVNNYAITAFVTSGFIGGFIYWLFAGRDAGDPQHHHAAPAVAGGPKYPPAKTTPAKPPAQGTSKR